MCVCMHTHMRIQVSSVCPDILAVMNIFLVEQFGKGLSIELQDELVQQSTPDNFKGAVSMLH